MSAVVHLRWAKGGTAEIVALEGETLTVRSTTPAPPGARLEATLDLESGSCPLKLKSYGSKREGDVFVLPARLVDVTREVRAAIAALVAVRVASEAKAE